ncbi:phage tail tape measure protein [Streptomyces sp. MNU76]|uniref:phage tail tape measure protein n=1 Tax=Streptomyces sp. MNU76 TaxID=2560026 RepID=UPI001E61587D|nr:phage tail tape measure protein [Streptomyces sp. MNU76]MCC9712085.1 phage tail tape measure protein [Streptomyces sp. MNU76]
MAEEVGVAFVRLVPSMRGFGPEAQQAMNDAMRGPANDAGQQAGDQAGGKFGQAFKGALLGAGLLAGAALIGGVTEALDQGRIVGKLRAQLGATPAEAKKYGEIAGELFAGAIVTDFQQGADTIRAVMSSGLVPAGATNKQIKSIATNAADLANTFDIDLQQAANAAGTMMKNGLAKNGTEAFDLLAAGMNGLGPASEDLMETFTEYGPIFKSAGISGQTALGLMRQAIKGGWGKDTDKIADAFKELTLQVTSGSEASAAALTSLGLDAKQIGTDMSAGGKRGEEAMGSVLAKIRELGPGSQTAKVAIQDLFGGPGEDLGAALFALDVGKASKAMDGAKGAADELGDGLRDNAGAKLTAFKNSMQQNLVEFLGGTVIPAVTTAGSVIGKELGGIWDQAGKGSEGAADRAAEFVRLLGVKIGQKIVEWAPKGIEALMTFGGKVADYIAANPGKVLKIGLITAAILLAIVALPITVGAALSAAVAVIMVGFVKEMVSKLNDNLPKWWQAFTGWVSQKATTAASVLAVLGTAVGRWFGGLWSKYISGPVGRQWTSFVGSVRALPGRAVSALSALGGNLSSTSSRAWQRFKDAASRKATDLLTWVRRLPGRAKSALGNIGQVLAASGRALIQGFITGIKNKIGQVRSAASSVVSAAREYFPFSPAKRGPFSGRGYTLYSGRALIQGFQTGITDQTPDLRAQLQHLPSTALQQQLSAGSRTAAAATAPTVVLDAHGMPRALVEWLRAAIRTEAGGSAEKFFKKPAAA